MSELVDSDDVKDMSIEQRSKCDGEAVRTIVVVRATY